MTVTHAHGGQPPSAHPLRPGASPHAIRTALLPEDRDAFDAGYEAALSAARTSLDLTALFTMLEHWRRVAALQDDRDDFRRVVRRAAELVTGERVPDDEPLSVTRAKVGM